MMTAEQQKELDIWTASLEKLLTGPSSDYVKGYNDGIASVVDALRQGNWTWDEYQEWLKYHDSNGE